MKTKHPTYRRRGVLLIEVALSLLLVGMLAGLTAYTLAQFSRARGQYTLREGAAWAAEGALQRFLAGAPLNSQPLADLVPPEIALTVRHEPGAGDWAAMTRVCVRATVSARHSRPIVEEVCGYVAEPQP